MYQGKLRKTTIIVLALYTALILYFLYLGFNRTSAIHGSSLRFNLIPDGIELYFPMGRGMHSWLFGMGNFIAFIPFGIIIPLLFRTRFLQFVLLFILSIGVLETLQMLSRLGSFDINDIILNTLGAVVGYCAQRLVTHNRDQLNGMCKIIATASVVSMVVFVIVGGSNHYLSSGSGKVIALNELRTNHGIALWEKSFLSVTAADTEAKPQLNLYSDNNKRSNEFTYRLGGNYDEMNGYFAIPDDLIRSANEGRSNIIFSGDGNVIYVIDLSTNFNGPDYFHIPLSRVNELTIKVVNHDPNPFTNVVMWDMTLSEVNKGQKLVNRMKEIVML